MYNRPWVIVFLFLFQAFADVRHRSGMQRIFYFLNIPWWYRKFAKAWNKREIQLLKASIIVSVNFYVCIEYTFGVRRIRLSLGKLVFHYNNTKRGSMLGKNMHPSATIYVISFSDRDYFVNLIDINHFVFISEELLKRKGN